LIGSLWVLGQCYHKGKVEWIMYANEDFFLRLNKIIILWNVTIV
jgi:hypothetical protein